MRRAAFLCLLVTGCFQPDDLEVGPLVAKLAGNCGDTGAEVTISEANRAVTVTTSAATELPAAGALSRDNPEGHLRDGNWILFGYLCLQQDQSCRRPEAYRMCTAHRSGWLLQLDCVDGFARAVCHGTLSE